MVLLSPIETITITIAMHIVASYSIISLHVFQVKTKWFAKPLQVDGISVQL